MKRILSIGVLTVFIFGLLMGFAEVIYAQEVQQKGFTALAPIPGLTSPDKTAVVNSDTLANFFNNLYKYLIGLAAALAVIQIIWAGIEIALNRDSVSNVLQYKSKIMQAILGLILVLSPVIVFSIINPSILNLSLNLPPLDTKSTPFVNQYQAPISDVERAKRETDGRKILFTAEPTISELKDVHISTYLETLVAKCTNYEGGPGIILPILGGAPKFVCQTCASNEVPKVLAPARRQADKAQGECKVKAI